MIATVSNGDGGQFAHYLMDAAGHWTQITRFEDEIVSVKVASDGSLDLLSHKNAPRGQILRLPLARLNTGKVDLAEAQVIVPQSLGPGAGHDDMLAPRSRTSRWLPDASNYRHHRWSVAGARL